MGERLGALVSGELRVFGAPCAANRCEAPQLLAVDGEAVDLLPASLTYAERGKAQFHCARARSCSAAGHPGWSSSARSSCSRKTLRLWNPRRLLRSVPRNRMTSTPAAWQM